MGSVADERLAPASFPQPSVPASPALGWEGGELDFRLSPWRGLEARGPAGEPRFHLGGVFALDLYGYDDRNSRDSGFDLDRAVVRLDGAYGPFEWRAAPDLKGTDTRGLDELWAAMTPARRGEGTMLRFSAGLQEIALGAEHGIIEEELPVFTYSFPAYLDGRSDWALRAEGELSSGIFSFDLAATAGEGFSRFGERLSGMQFSARGVTYPLRWLDDEIALPRVGYTLRPLSGLFFGLGYAYVDDYGGPLEVGHPFRNKLFTVDRFEADSSAFLHFSYGLDLGPLIAVHEVVRGGYHDIHVPGDDPTLDDQTTAWSLLVAWTITGEPYDLRPLRQRAGRPGPFPRRPLWGAPGAETGPGAVEIAGRYANGDIDRQFFDTGVSDPLGFTREDLSSQEFRVFSMALNWYPVWNLRASFEVARTIADGFPRTFDSHGRDTSVAFRLQYRF